MDENKNSEDVRVNFTDIEKNLETPKKESNTSTTFHDNPASNDEAQHPPLPDSKYSEFEQELPTFNIQRGDSGVYHPENKFIWGMRMNLYVCFFIYMIFANVILLCGRWNLKNEQILDRIVGLQTSERRLEEMFLYNGIMLATAAILGVYALMTNKYSVFLIFAVGLLFSFCFASATLFKLNKAGNKMDSLLNGETAKVEKVFEKQIPTYNWTEQLTVNNKYINQFQLSFACCGGAGGFKDWDNKRPDYVGATGTFPFTCCDLDVGGVFIKRQVFCPFEKVEKRPSCPDSFKAHLIVIRNNFSAQSKIMFQVIIAEALTFGLFVYKLFKTNKLVRYEPSGNNLYSLTEE